MMTRLCLVQIYFSSFIKLEKWPHVSLLVLPSYMDIQSVFGFELFVAVGAGVLEGASEVS